MKVALIVFALIGLGFSAPQPKKDFHEHFEEFIYIIISEAGDELNSLLNQYLQFDEFNAAMDYIKTNNFKDLIDEMEHLPEFQAVFDFLENDNIDIHFFLDMFNDALDIVKRARIVGRHTASGTDFASFIEDSISVFPKDKLSALFDQKMAEDDEFRTAIENLQGEEWDTVFSALWESSTFKVEVQSLLDNGIDIHAFLHEIIAVFGQ